MLSVLVCSSKLGPSFVSCEVCIPVQGNNLKRSLKMQKLAECRGPLTKSVSSDGTAQRKKIINTQTIVSEEGHYEFVFQRK